MNQFISTIFVASLAFSAYSVYADDKSNTEHAKDGLTHNQQSRSGKMMDANSDGMVSKEEFMAHHEKMYSSMKQTNGGVSLQDMDAEMNAGTTKGNKLQPSDAKNAPPAAK